MVFLLDGFPFSALLASVWGFWLSTGNPSCLATSLLCFAAFSFFSLSSSDQLLFLEVYKSFMHNLVNRILFVCLFVLFFF